jgi:hypothetical protein
MINLGHHILLHLISMVKVSYEPPHCVVFTIIVPLQIFRALRLATYMKSTINVLYDRIIRRPIVIYVKKARKCTFTGEHQYVLPEDGETIQSPKRRVL